MAKSASDLTVAELEQLLNNRKAELDSLLRKREKLQLELQDVEQQIRTLQGKKAAAKSSLSKPRLSMKRPHNDRPLHEYVTEILDANKKGLTLSGLAKKVLEAGYQTYSTNFNNVLYQCLYHLETVEHEEETGLYRLK